MKAKTTAMMFDDGGEGGGERATPLWFFEVVNQEFGFTIDIGATRKNRKCERYIGRRTDALKIDWPLGEVIWCNPPYGNVIAVWLAKGYDAARSGSTVVFLLPARTETIWFQTFAPMATEVRFLRSRLTFPPKTDPAPFPSILMVFRPSDLPSAATSAARGIRAYTWDAQGREAAIPLAPWERELRGPGVDRVRELLAATRARYRGTDFKRLKFGDREQIAVLNELCSFEEDDEDAEAETLDAVYDLTLEALGRGTVQFGFPPVSMSAVVERLADTFDNADCLATMAVRRLDGRLLALTPEGSADISPADDIWQVKGVVQLLPRGYAVGRQRARLIAERSA